jgi:CheY-like chemotaxis protein
MTLELDQNIKLHAYRILVVDDNVLNQKLVVFMLQSRGFETEVCSDGKEALEKLRKEKFDLVLMDVEMPEMNGYEATEKIRHELGLDIPVIALTAHASDGEREKCLSHGMSDYLSKPFKGEEFYHIISSHLAGEIEHTNID